MSLMMVKLILVVAGLLTLGLWQLWDINRELKKHRDTDAGNDAEEDSRAGRD